MRVWVTRTQPGAGATAERLRSLGHEPVVSPVLEVHVLQSERRGRDVGAFAFTSANAVESFAWEPLTSADLNLPVFTVGDATADAARRVGFTDVTSARGDVHALADLIVRERARIHGMVLQPANAEPAGGDVGVLLAEHGVSACSVPTYETVAVDPWEALAALDSIDAVLVHSPKAARRLAGLVAPGQAEPVFACISEAAAAPLRAAGHEKVRSAPFPDEAALLKLLQDD